MTQFQKITLDDAIARYQNRELTAKGLLRLYFEIKLKPGWEMKKTPKDIYSEIGLGRTAFYNAFAALREEEIIEADDPDLKQLSITRPIRECGQQSATTDTNSANVDKQSATADTNSANADKQSATAENESPELLSTKDSSIPSYSSSDLFSNFSTYSLSEREKEKIKNLEFFNSQDELTKEAILKTGNQYFVNRLREYPALPDKWIQCNSIEISQNIFFQLEYSKLVEGKNSEIFLGEFGEFLDCAIAQGLIKSYNAETVVFPDGSTRPTQNWINKTLFPEKEGLKCQK